jgi:hypothetical protein
MWPVVIATIVGTVVGRLVNRMIDKAFPPPPTQPTPVVVVKQDNG